MKNHCTIEDGSEEFWTISHISEAACFWPGFFLIAKANLIDQLKILVI